MEIEKIYAQLSCSDLTQSTAWFEMIFDREPDARPMTGLVEWHHQARAGLQLFENDANAGQGTLTLIVRDLQSMHSRLTDCGMRPPDIESADTVNIVRLRDPDGNLVVLAQPRDARISNQEDLAERR